MGVWRVFRDSFCRNGAGLQAQIPSERILGLLLFQRRVPHSLHFPRSSHHALRRLSPSPPNACTEPLGPQPSEHDGDSGGGVPLIMAPNSEDMGPHMFPRSPSQLMLESSS